MLHKNHGRGQLMGDTSILWTDVTGQLMGGMSVLQTDVTGTVNWNEF